MVVQTASGPGDAAAVQLRLLGDFGLTVDGEQRTAGLPARAPTLLAYLILRTGTGQSRQRVAQLLWPESTDGQARTNLRNVLHHLRRSAPWLAGLLEAGPGTLRWVGGARCHVDLTRFLTAVEVSRTAEAGTRRQQDALREAVRSYEGDLLAGSSDECLADDRVRLREVLLAAMRQLVGLLSDGDPANAADAVAYGQDLVRRDPLNEEHHRLLMAAYQAAGDRAGAVRAYHVCVAVLHRELKVAPSAVTRDAYNQLVNDPAGLGGAAEPGRPAPFVGRATELAELVRRWREAAVGGPALAVVSGEPGVGKTRLVEELAVRCGRAGGLVVSARCYAGEGELGYGAVIDWLRSPELAVSLRRISAADRRQLVPLMPELASPGDPVKLSRPGEMDRLRLFDAVVRVLIGGGRPMLLVLDDAHWCDRPSLQLLHYLIRSGRDRPVLVVATVRGEEIDDQHPLTMTRRPLMALGRVSQLDLPRLSPQETSLLVSALAPTVLDESARRRLHAQTEGNPLFVVEALRGGWAGVGDVGLTPRLQSVIADRLARLSEGARELVAVAATIGRAFTADLLARATGRDEPAVVRGLDELWRRGVIVGHGVHEYDFSHGRIRDVARESLTPVARRGWHLAVAKALAGTQGHDLDERSGQVAAHLERAGQVAQAIDWYERATTQALLRSAPTEAYGMLRRAIVLARGLPGESGAAVELRLLAMAPPVLGGVDGYASDRLAGYQRRARAVAARLGVEVPAPLLRSSVMDSLCRDHFDQAAEGAARLLAIAQRSNDPGLAVESRYLMGIAAFWSGDVSTAATRFREVVADSDEDGRSAHLVRFGQDPQVVCLSRLANALFFLGDIAAARSTVDDALMLARAVGDRYTRDIAHVFAAVLAADLGDAQLLDSAVEVFRGRRRAGFVLLKSEAVLGYADVLDGRAVGIDRIEASVRRCGARNPAPGFVPTLYRLLVGAYDLAGDAAGALAAADRALALPGTRLWEPEIRRVRRRWHTAAEPPAKATPHNRQENAAPGRLPA